MRTRTIAVLAIVAGAAAAAALLGPLGPGAGGGPVLPFLGPPADDAGAPGLLRYRVGDHLVYTAEGGGERGTVDVRVLAPRAAVAANLSRVEALPVLSALRTGGAPAWDAALADVRHGGLVVSVEGCLVDASLPCASGGDVAYVTWQECPFNGGFSPADMVPRAALQARTWTVADPAKPGTSWTFAVERQGSRVRFEPQAATGERPLCGGAEAFTIDLATGLVVEARLPALRLTLASASRGAGPEVAVGGGPPQASRFLPPTAARTKPYPPGAEGLGEPAWRLGEAWARAEEGSREFRDFLARNPDAFLYAATNTSASAELVQGTVRESTQEWRFQLLTPSRTMVEVVSTRKTTQDLPPQHEARLLPAAVPDRVPQRFTAPAREAVDLQAFAQAAAGHGYRPSPSFPQPLLSVKFDGGDADWFYQLFLRASGAGTGGVTGAGSSEWLGLNADTGRLTDVYLPRAQARALVAP